MEKTYPTSYVSKVALLKMLKVYISRNKDFPNETRKGKIEFLQYAYDNFEKLLQIDSNLVTIRCCWNIDYKYWLESKNDLVFSRKFLETPEADFLYSKNMPPISRSIDKETQEAYVQYFKRKRLSELDDPVLEKKALKRWNELDLKKQNENGIN